MNTIIKILVLEDNPNDADLMDRELKKYGLTFTSSIVKTREEFEDALQSFRPDIILSDYSLPAFNAATAFRIKQKEYPHIPFIIVSGIIGEENAVELIKEGVTDYTPKNKLYTLFQKISRALKDAEERREKVINTEKLRQQTSELIILNKQLLIQNEEKEKQAAELISVNKELVAFTYVSSHDLQEPLRKIQTFVKIILDEENKNLSDKGKYNLQRMEAAAVKMQQLIHDLLAFSRISSTDRTFEKADIRKIIEEVKAELKDTIEEKHATIEASDLCSCTIIPFQFRQLMYNLISNALKFSHPNIPAHIIINSRIIKSSKSLSSNGNGKAVYKNLLYENDYCHITVSDNGIGFEKEYSEKIFEVFQCLNNKEDYAGTGIGLSIVKKIVENHNGIITATGELGKGARFDILIPA